MGIAKKTDGRYVVGVGVDNANDYKGSAAYRDIYIQLTSSGATAKSEEYLTFLKDYAVNANALGEPIMPPSVNVWISNNGVTTAVEADDVSIDGNNYTICGIKWNGSTWDYSGAGQGKSGSSLPSYTSADKGKFLCLGEDAEHLVEPKWEAVGGGGDGVKIVELVQNTDTDNNACDALIKYNNNVLTSYEAVAAFITENPAIIAILSGVSSYEVMLPTRSTIVEGDLSAYYLFSVNGNQMSAGWTTR